MEQVQDIRDFRFSRYPTYLIREFQKRHHVTILFLIQPDFVTNLLIKVLVKEFKLNQWNRPNYGNKLFM